jgi:predicted GNAT superfamily acetyltransferase
MEIRELTKLEEFNRCVELQKIIWGFDDPYDLVPVPLLLVSQRNDGIVLGAFNGDVMTGFVYSLPGTHKGVKLQWSHMLAVLEEYRNSDIGYRLKMAQYEMAQRLGYELIEWTYDPLESRNAHFNLKKLGCLAFEYEVNVYGETSSPLHKGMPTDRFIAHWAVPPFEKELPAWPAPPESPALVTQTRTEGKALVIDGVDLTSKETFVFIEIPENIQAVKTHSSEAAMQWRLKTREAFLHYLKNGYVVYSFVRFASRSFYVLRALPPRANKRSPARS